MTIFDAILLIIWAGFVFYGFFYGLIRYIGLFFGVIIGIFVAIRTYTLLFDYIELIFIGFTGVGHVVSFIIVFGLVNNVVLFGFIVLDKIFKLVSIIPFLKTFNRLGGALLGLFLGASVLGVILYVSSRHFIVGQLFGDVIYNSQIAPILIKFSAIYTPLFPEAIEMMRTII